MSPPARLDRSSAIRCFSSRALDSSAAAKRDDDSASQAPRLTHIDASGRASMVDVGHKERTRRTATASGRILVPRVAFELITSRSSTEDESHSDTSGPGADSGKIAELARAKAKARAKGDVLTVAQLAAIMGCKRTHELIPLCHPLQLSHIAVTLHPEVRRLHSGRTTPASDTSGDERRCGDRSASGVPSSCAQATRSDVGEKEDVEEFSVVCRAVVSCEGKTGVEMEALTAVSVGLLTVWDMLKAVAGQEMIIQEILVERKAGGKSGDFVREDR